MKNLVRKMRNELRQEKIKNEIVRSSYSQN